MDRDKKLEEAVRRVAKRETQDALFAETERGVALIAGEWLDDCLEVLLRLRFIAVGISKDKQGRLLTDFGAPFTTFSMKISVCDAFGVLPHEVCDMLDAIRRVRNHCAHTPGVVLLDDLEISSEIKRFWDSSKGDPDFEREPSNKLALITVTGKMAIAIFEAAKGISDNEIGPKYHQMTTDVRPLDP